MSNTTVKIQTPEEDRAEAAALREQNEELLLEKAELEKQLAQEERDHHQTYLTRVAADEAIEALWDEIEGFDNAKPITFDDEIRAKIEASLTRMKVGRQRAAQRAAEKASHESAEASAA